MKKDKPIPPLLFHRFFRWYCHPKLRDHIEGDLMEVYYERVKASGKRNADRRFIIDVLLLFRPGIIRPAEGYKNLTNYGMFKSYFKIGWRNLLRNKGYSFISIGGLAVGMAITILIGLWTYDEVTYNQSFENYDRLGQVMVHNGVGTYKSQPIPLAAELRSSFPGEFKHVVMSTQTQEYIISSEGKKFMQMGNYMQPDAPEMLSLKMIAGTWQGLRDPHAILISESLSRKLYGTNEPLGKEVMINNELNVSIAGVFKDFPDNTEFKSVTFIAPWDLMIASYDYVRDHQDDWRGNFLHVFVQIRATADFDLVSQKIKDVKLKYVSKERAADKPALFLHPMSRWHLYSKFENRVQTTSEQLKFVWFYSLIGMFILLLASINFMNLTTARSEKRAKEVGLRKTVGSLQTQLVYQFLSESFLIVGIASTIAILLVQFTLPLFNDIAGKELEILWTNGTFWALVISFMTIAGLLSGSYPALYLSSLNPVKALKGTSRLHHGTPISRKILVTVQFTVSIMLTVGTIIVYQQLQFGKDRPVGYTRDGLVMIRKTSPEFQGKFEVLDNELKNSGVVAEVAESASTVTSIWGFNAGFNWNGKDPDLQESFGTISVSHDFGKAVNWQLVDGRDFSKQVSSDSAAFIINETAAKYMGLKDPIDKIVKWDTEYFDGGDFRIVGVIKDMVMSSPFEPAQPTIFFLQGYKGWILLKINPEISASEALLKIEDVFRKIVPNAPFDYRFASDAYASKFKTEERIGKLALVFTVLAVFISCLGLVGLASFVAEQRTREIGIRKVLGATVSNLWQMLSRDFVVLVIISCFIAIPIGYYFMNSWLQQYEYRTEISMWVFLMTSLGSLVVTLLTVSYQSVRAALMNPVNSLRTE